MFIERLFNSGAQPLVEQSLHFTSARHKLLAENIANLDTPGYVQRDLDEKAFVRALAKRSEMRGSGAGATFEDGVKFGDIEGKQELPAQGVVFHDGNNRSVEQLMAEFSKNGLTHNMYIEFLRNQFATLKMALKERVS